MNYLGFLLQKKVVEVHIKDRVRRATLTMAKAWSVGERLFSGDFRKTKMFDALVASVALYRSEIWGWFKDDRIDRVKRKYLK